MTIYSAFGLPVAARAFTSAEFHRLAAALVHLFDVDRLPQLDHLFLISTLFLFPRFHDNLAPSLHYLEQLLIIFYDWRLPIRCLGMTIILHCVLLKLKDLFRCEQVADLLFQFRIDPALLRNDRSLERRCLVEADLAHDVVVV